MVSYRYKVNRQVFENIDSFYEHVALRYVHTYSFELLKRNINEAYNSIYMIERGLLRRKPILQKWQGLYMANTDKWYFAYRIEGNTIFVVDSCHAQNMHEKTN